MPWTDEQHRAAEHATRLYLQRREAEGRRIDPHPRAVATLALENTGNTAHPTGPSRRGTRLRRALTSGRYDRWATVVWRAELARQLARSKERRERITAPTPNRAQRRAAAKLRRKADR